MNLLNRPAALVIAHPGHELRVYHWVSLARPLVFVLTDGSGRTGWSRLHRTEKILSSLGARPGNIFGRLTDAGIYSAILNGDVSLFLGLADEMARAMLADKTEYVVGDAIEGYNPAHDILRLVTNAALKQVERAGTRIENFDVLFSSNPAVPGAEDVGMIAIEADETVLTKKLAAASEYSELEVDVNRILAQEGAAALRTEYLRPAQESLPDSLYSERPYYEVHGEEQVRAGYYEQVIRYREHILPIARALQYIGERAIGKC